MEKLGIHFIVSNPPRHVGLRRRLEGIVLQFALNPDEGSHFDRETRDIRRLRHDQVLPELGQRGYDCIMAEDRGEFVGLVGFQKRAVGYQGRPEPTWHSFAYHVPPAYEGRGIGKVLAHAFLDAGFKAGIRSMRFYAGDERGMLSETNRKKMAHLYQNVILGGQLGLEFDVERGHEKGWLKFKERVAVNA